MIPNVRSVTGIRYAEVPGFRPLELDLYRAESPAPAPVLVHLHGGGWRRGSRRETLPAVGAGFYPYLAGEGFAVAAADYRLSGEARFPAQLDDVRAAIGWVAGNAAAYSLDAGRVFLWGDSAGGHLALLAALTGSAVQGVVAWFPVTDLLAMPSDIADAGGTPDEGPDSREARLLGAPAPEVPDLARLASPVTHVSAAAPPVLLMHGADDDLVPPAQSVRLAAALRAAGATAELDLVPGAAHMWHGATDVAGIVHRSVGFLRALL